MYSLRSIFEKIQIGLSVIGGVLREYAYENFGLKLFALLIAIVLWGAVSKQEATQAILQGVRLEYVNLPDGLAISNSDTLDAANVQLRGPKDVLNRLRPEMLAIRVNLANTKPGDEPIVQLSHSDVSVPPNVEVVDIEPQRARLTIERIIERQINVVPRFADNVPQDYEVISHSVNPSVVTISGPESHVNAVADAPTETIRLADQRKSFTKRLNIDIKDLKVRIVDSPMIEVQVQIGEVRIERRIAGLPLRMVPSVEKVSFTPATVAVEVEGLKSVVEGLKPSDISALIDFKDSPDTTVAKPRIVLPPATISAVTVKSVDPPEIHIKRHR